MNNRALSCKDPERGGTPSECSEPPCPVKETRMNKENNIFNSAVITCRFGVLTAYLQLDLCPGSLLGGSFGDLQYNWARSTVLI